MKQLAATALLALVALLAVSAGESATARPAPVTLQRAGTWTFAGVPPMARTNVAADVAQATPAARRLLDLLDGRIAIDTDTTRCGHAEACSYREASQGRPWTIHLPASMLAGTYPSQRFIVLHEMGHAVWGLVLRSADHDAFVSAITRSLGGRACRTVRDGRPCAITGEVFADEFARWAGGFRVSMTWYDTPALLSTASFGALVDHALGARA